MNIEKIISKLTLKEKAGIISGINFWYTKAVERVGIPSVMMCDGPNGLRKQKGKGDHLGINESIETVCYPTASAMAASFDKELLNRLGDMLGKECQSENVGMLLGPGINMKRSPLCGRNFEYFSEDPYLSGKLAVAYIKGVQDNNVATCVKHFAANNQETCRMSSSSRIDERTLNEIYLPAFEEAVKEGKTRSIMCAYNAVNDVFCTENKELLTEILRNKWGFNGFVVTDWGAGKDEVKGIKAGLDLIMPGGLEETTQIITEAVKNGELDEKELDVSVRNILKFVSKCMEAQGKDSAFNRDEAEQLAYECARESAVLLKNDDEILPLSKSKKVVFIGEFAKSPRYQGAGSSHINVKHAVSAMECVDEFRVDFARGYYSRDEITDDELIKEAVQKAIDADAAVIFAGLPDTYETEGADREHMRMPDNQNRLIEEVAKVQSNTIVVLHGGAPMELPWLDKVKAVLCMYLGGCQVGKATVDLIYGVANPSGKLAETWPKRLEDNPSYLDFPGHDGIATYGEGIYVGYRYYDKKKIKVNFPFGHGLSYSKFMYSDIKTSKEHFTDEEKVKVSCKVKNTGLASGKEVVQLYVGDVDSSVKRPIRELKGFEKIYLEPGEEKEIFFELDKRSFAYYEEMIHDWFVESGKFIIEIGSSSRDIRLSCEVNVDGSVELPIKYTENSTLLDLGKTKRGRAFMEQMRAKRQALGNEDAEKSKEDVSNLGEGSERMVEAMMREMPLGTLVSYGAMTKQELKQLVNALNG